MGAVDWVYVGGTFDLFHAGHVRLLQAAAGHGPVVVAVNTDAFAGRYKRLPIMTEEERREVVAACRFVDRTVFNIGDEDSRTTIDMLKRWGINVRYVVHGDDWRGEELMRQMGFSPGWLAAAQIEMLYLPYTPGVSSSQIMDRVKGRA